MDRQAADIKCDKDSGGVLIAALQTCSRVIDEVKDQNINKLPPEL